MDATKIVSSTDTCVCVQSHLNTSAIVYIFFISFSLALFAAAIQHVDSKNLAAEKRFAMQRSLNEGGTSRHARDKRRVTHKLISLREERANYQYRHTRKVGREISSESYKRMVSRFDEVFNADLADFMMQLNSHTATGLVANLGIRLDYNGYVTSAIASNNRLG